MAEVDAERIQLDLELARLRALLDDN